MNHTTSPTTGTTTTDAAIAAMCTAPALLNGLSFVRARPGYDWLAVPDEPYTTGVVTGVSVVHELLSTARSDDEEDNELDHAFEYLIEAACAELAKPHCGGPDTKGRRGAAVGVMYSVSRLLASATVAKTDDGETMPALAWLQAEICSHLKNNRIDAV
jgi:hypothetical protein